MPVYQGFDDKLAPAHRWLRAQAGRPWNKVRGELLSRFDTRTTAGRHIVFDHLLKSVERAFDPFTRRHDMFVDQHGILRISPFRRQRGMSWQPLPESAVQIRAWLRERRVTAHGDSLFWLVPTRAGHYRQDKALSVVEAERWRALPAWYLRQLEQEFVARARQEEGP
jgi:hypothetical protein